MADDHLHALPKGHRIDEYEIVRVLGAGGFGITYLAFDHHLNEPVALKEYFYAGLALRRRDGTVVPISSGRAAEYDWGRNRFLEEARVLTKLRHPNVIRVRRYIGANNTAYIVMDYVEGESLAQFLDKHGTLRLAQWQPWLEALLDGLEHLHHHNYLHRDIKPDNIVIRAADSEPVLIDFGAARQVPANTSQHLTRLLTPGYAPIEQHSETKRQGPFTDIYSMAAVSYRVLTGEPPPNAVDRAQEDDFEPLVQRQADNSSAMLAAIDHALAIRGPDRPQTVNAWRQELQGFLGIAAKKTERDLAAVRRRLQDYADRGVFRGYAETSAPAGKYHFRFLWLADQPFKLTYEPASGTLTFTNVLPHVLARSKLAAELRRFVASRSASSLPADRRIDSHRARAECSIRRGSMLVHVVAKPGCHAYGVTKLVNLVHEIFLHLHSYFPEYQWEHLRWTPLAGQFPGFGKSRL